jgi:transposase
VRDTLEEHGWEVLVADAQEVKGPAPLACNTDRVDARALAELSWRDLADHRYIPLLVTAPGFGWINAFTVASEIGAIERFPSPGHAVRLHLAVPAGGPIRQYRPPRPDL